MILDDNELRALAEEAFEASLDAHGYPVSSSEAWEFMISQVLPVEFPDDEDLDALQASPMPTTFHLAYRDQMNRYLRKMAESDDIP